jgi:hypothetical protein
MSVTPVDPNEAARIGEETGRALAERGLGGDPGGSGYSRADQAVPLGSAPPPQISDLRAQSEAAYQASRPGGTGGGSNGGGGDEPLTMEQMKAEAEKAGITLLEAKPNPDGTWTIEPECPLTHTKFKIVMGPPKGSFMIETQRIINAGSGGDTALARDPFVVNLVRASMFIRSINDVPQNKPATWLEYKVIMDRLGEIVLEACASVYSTKWPSFAVVNLPLSGR